MLKEEKNLGIRDQGLPTETEKIKEAEEEMTRHGTCTRRKLSNSLLNLGRRGKRRRNSAWYS